MRLIRLASSYIRDRWEMQAKEDDLEIWSEVVYGEDEAGGVSLVDLNTTNPERMDTPCTRIRECRSDSQR